MFKRISYLLLVLSFFVVNTEAKRISKFDFEKSDKYAVKVSPDGILTGEYGAIFETKVAQKLAGFIGVAAVFPTVSIAAIGNNFGKNALPFEIKTTVGAKRYVQGEAMSSGVYLSPEFIISYKRYTGMNIGVGAYAGYTFVHQKHWLLDIAVGLKKESVPAGWTEAALLRRIDFNRVADFDAKLSVGWIF